MSESTINSHKDREWLFTVILCLIVTLLLLPFTSKCKINDYVWLA